jgi:DHA1 family bicyclomycin/chloramphenicol resistance-like MFS transporter
MLVSGISPVIAPVVGSMLVNPLGWRGLMWILTALVGIGLVAVLLFVRESRPHVMCESKYRTAGVTTVRTLISRTYLGNMLAFVFAFTGMMAYISASPFLYQTLMGMNEIKYGLVFGFNALALMIVGAVSARLTRRRVCVAKIARAGLLINLTAVASLALLVSTSVPPIWFAVPILFAVGSLGLVFGNTIALALAAVPAAAGFASAVLGMLQHVLAGAVAPLVGIAGEHTALPLSLTMLAASVIANLAFAASTRTRC